jgi:hypothetical protein
MEQVTQNPWRWYVSITSSAMLVMAAWIINSVSNQGITLAELKIQLGVVQTTNVTLLMEARKSERANVRQEEINNAFIYRITQIEAKAKK